MTIRTNFLKIDFKNRSIELGVSVFMFKDGDHEIAYIPALKLSAYGKTKGDAREMLTRDVLDDFFRTLFGLENEEKIIAELSKFGWKRHSVQSKEFDAPVINETGVIEDFKLPAATRLTEEFLTRAEKVAA